jgi:drug/metabolite transporter (DMT)-like permease
LVIAAIAWAAAGAVWPASPSAMGLASAAVSGVLYYGLAYWMYLWALRRMPASIAAASFYLIPVFGLVASFLVLGERLTTLQSIGAGVVLLAVLGIVRLATPSGVQSTASPR